VVVTVDDGYEDFGRIAHPIFEEHGIPSMLFVTTDFVDGKTWFWWDRLEYALRESAPERHRITLGQDQIDLDLSNPAKLKRAWHRIADRGRFLSDQDKEDLVTSVARELGIELPDRAPAGYEPLTWDQVRALRRRGAAFGAHTCRHPILSRITVTEAEVEITESGRRLAEELGEPARWFCYPQGGPADWTPDVRRIVARRFAGCYLAYQTLDDPADPYTMPRYCLTPDMLSFRWTLCGAEYLILRLRRILGLSTGVGASYWADHAPSRSGATEESP
jgi:peptidoglycan/xylan/chitin deacetylase (PgdA/CDA1 family)